MVDKITNTTLQILRLYRLNYAAQYYVREIAKLTGKSHVTLLPHLHRLEKDKILTSRTLGKNKMYSLNLHNIMAKQYLLLAEVMESTEYWGEIFVIKKLTTELFTLGLSGAVILFGSYAKRTFHKDSDIDLLYIGTITEDEIQKIKEIGTIYGKIINIKNSTLEHFEAGLRRRDALLTEIVKNHLLLHNGELFINSLWRYFNEIK